MYPIAPHVITLPPPACLLDLYSFSFRLSCQYQIGLSGLDKRKEKLYKRQAGGGSVMTWGGIGYIGRTPIAFLEGNQDSQCYQRTLERSLLPYLDQIVDGDALGSVYHSLINPPVDILTIFATAEAVNNNPLAYHPGALF